MYLNFMLHSRTTYNQQATTTTIRYPTPFIALPNPFHLTILEFATALSHRRSVPLSQINFPADKDAGLSPPSLAQIEALPELLRAPGTKPTHRRPPCGTTGAPDAEARATNAGLVC
jgi:hypothetical protein